MASNYNNHIKKLSYVTIFASAGTVSTDHLKTSSLYSV